MATRRPASSGPNGLGPARAATRGWRLSWLILGLALAPLSASAQYMALTAPPKPHAPLPAVPKPVPPTARSPDHALNGTLPNQRTGPSRPRVVRDICIGCDR